LSLGSEEHDKDIFSLKQENMSIKDIFSLKSLYFECYNKGTLNAIGHKKHIKTTPQYMFAVLSSCELQAVLER